MSQFVLKKQSQNHLLDSLMVTMTQTKRAMYTTLHNDDTVFIAYGTQDITTVPLEFTTGKLFIRNIAYT